MSNLATTEESNIISLNTEIVVEQRADIISAVDALQINDKADVDLSVEYEQQLKENKKLVEETFDPIVKKAHAAHKALTARRSEYLKPLEAAIEKVQAKRNAYIKEQQRIQQEQEAALLKAQQEAEEAERLRQAELAEARGDNEGAEAILSGQAAVHVPSAPAFAQTQPKTEGLVTKTVYTVVCEDKMALVKAIASGRDDLLHLLVIDQSALNKLAAATKENFKVAGCSLKKDITTHTRS